jgi:hypothetical protein
MHENIGSKSPADVARICADKLKQDANKKTSYISEGRRGSKTPALSLKSSWSTKGWYLASHHWAADLSRSSSGSSSCRSSVPRLVLHEDTIHMIFLNNERPTPILSISFGLAYLKKLPHLNRTLIGWLHLLHLTQYCVNAMETCAVLDWTVASQLLTSLASQ